MGNIARLIAQQDSKLMAALTQGSPTLGKGARAP
jgi:hypothetical protein